MGCICGPSIANLFVHILERKWIQIFRPPVYNRFIDDIFFCVNTKIDINEFQSYFLNLKFTFEQAESVNFLDLVIKYDSITKKLKFSMYIKPTNTFSYLITTSNHPNYIFENIPKSLFIRNMRICDSITDFYYFSRKLIFQLYERGYDFKKLVSVCYSIGQLDRNDLIPYKDKTNDFYKSNQLTLGMNFNKFISNNKDVMMSAYEKIKNNYNWLHDYKS